MRSIRTFIAYSAASLALVSLAIWFATVANSHEKTSVARSDSEAIADLEKQKVEFWRTPYDISAVQDRMERAGAPEALVLRLAFGR